MARKILELNVNEYDDIFTDNSVYLFDHYTIKIPPYLVKWYETLLVLTVGLAGLLWSGYTFIKEPPTFMSEYFLFACILGFSIFCFWAVYFYCLKKHPAWFINYMGIYNEVDKKLIAWKNIKMLSHDFLGYKFTLRNSTSIRIHVRQEENSLEDYYRFNQSMQNLIWIHSKYSFDKTGYANNLLRHLSQGMEFGKKHAAEYRDSWIKNYTRTLLYIVLVAAAASIFVFFDWQNNEQFSIGSWKAMGIFPILIGICGYQAVRTIIDANSCFKAAQIIKANPVGLDIQYPDIKYVEEYTTYQGGIHQKVTWEEIKEVWKDPNYGADGVFHFAIFHSTDGGILLIDLLSYAVSEYTENESNVNQESRDIL